MPLLKKGSLNEYFTFTTNIRRHRNDRCSCCIPSVMQYPDGDYKVKKIGDQIHKGALTFMKTEYKYLLIFIAVLVLLVWFALGMHSAIAVITGAACSSLAGFIGMYAATKANVRTATAAQQDGAAAA